VSELNKKIYATIEAWRNRPIEGEHPYVYLDGIVLKRSWAGEVRNVSLLVAIGVNSEGYREILGICEGAKEDKAGWGAFLRHLKERGLAGVRLIISDACLGLSESAAEVFPKLPGSGASGGKRHRLAKDFQVCISRCAHGGVFWLPNCPGRSCRERATRTHWH
jgi:hypothetical protein